MISIEYTKKIDLIDKLIEFFNKSKLDLLEYDILEYENKYTEIIDDFYKNNSLTLVEDLEEVKNLSEAFFRKYSRNIVRTNANLEHFINTLKKEDISFLNLEKLILMNKNIEDLIFNVEDTKNLKYTNDVKTAIKENRNFFFKLINLKEVFSSLIVNTKIPANYRELEITFYTDEQNIESYSSRILSFKLLYEIILRIENLDENNGLIILKAEKEKNEYFKLAGLDMVIDKLQNMLKNWIQEYLEKMIISSSTNKKDKMSFDKKIKDIFSKLNKDDFDKYSELIKKSLANFQIDKCISVEIFSEELLISNNKQIIETPKKVERELSFNERILQNKNDILQNIETSLLLKSSVPPENNLISKDSLEKGINLMSLRRYTEAVEFFNKAIELRPNYAEAYNLKANAYIQNGQFNEAISLLDYAITLKPNYRDAYLNKGTALFSLKKIEESILQYTKAIRLDPKCHEAYFNLGSCFMMLPNRKLEAIKAFSKAIELKHDYPSAYYNRACAYCTEGDIENCLNDLETVIKLDRTFKNIIKFDDDFSSVADNLKFKELVK